MCSPDHYGVDYVINPWMAGQCGKTDRALAKKQWENLKKEIGAFADILEVPAQFGLPDMVFTANAGLVWDGRVVVKPVLNVERQGKSPFLQMGFRKRSRLRKQAAEIPFEGAGDALWDRPCFVWIGSGFRLDVAAPAFWKEFSKNASSHEACRFALLPLDKCLLPWLAGT